MKLQGREGVAEGALSAESGEGTENEIGPLDDEQMGETFHPLRPEGGRERRRAEGDLL